MQKRRGAHGPAAVGLGLLRGRAERRVSGADWPVGEAGRTASGAGLAGAAAGAVWVWCVGSSEAR